MKPRNWVLILWIGVLSIGLLGCRTDPNIAILERELRSQEREIDDLDELLREYRLALNSCRRENATIRKELENDTQGAQSIGPDTSTDSGPSIMGLPPGIAGPTEKPRASSKSTKKSNTPGKIDSLRPPKIELPTEGKMDELPDSLQVPSEAPPAETYDIPDSIRQPTNPAQLKSSPPAKQNIQPKVSPESDKSADSSRVEKIVLAELLSGGLNADGRPGHEGISILIEPRDKQGQLVAAEAPISVVVLDPALQGQAARVARWEFTAHETKKMFRKSLFGQGIHLEMVWPASPPVHTELKIYVRYTTSDGRKLETDKQIDIDLLAKKDARWTTVVQVASTDTPTPLQAPRLIGPSLGNPSSIEPLPAVERPSNTVLRAEVVEQASRPAWSPYRQ